MSMFRTAQHLRGVLTLFHNPNIAKSCNVLSYIDKKYPDRSKAPFQLEVNPADPTKQQLTILEELAPQHRREFESNGIPRPTLVDWFNGKIAIDYLNAAKTIVDEIKDTE